MSQSVKPHARGSVNTLQRIALLTPLLAASPGAFAQSAADIINGAADQAAIEAQLEGQFGAMAREPSLPLGAIQEAWSRADTKAGTYQVTYSPDEVIRVRVREKMPVTIVLPEWETATAITNGDTYVFSYNQVAKNMIVVEALHVGADATLTAIGASGRVYPFYLRAEGFKSTNVPDIVVYVQAGSPSGSVQMTPFQPAQAVGTGGIVQASAHGLVEAPAADSEPAKPGKPAGPEGTGLQDPDFLEHIDPGKLQFGFTMSGDKTIAPDRVFSDGVFTYFDWGDRWEETDLPAIYRVVDGVDTPQNVRYRDGKAIVEATGAFTLRNGQRTVCVRPVGWEPTRPAQPPRRGIKAVFGG
jgi:ComB9 competence protein